MKIYLAGGYSVMKSKGLEKRLRNRFNPWRRLVSYYDLFRGNPILVTMGKQQR